MTINHPPKPDTAFWVYAHPRQKSLPSDIREEQAKLAAAELLVFQFPLWWYGPPAILKGWLDRVLTEGFAFGDLDPTLGVPRRFGVGGRVGRRALVVVTAGEDEGSLGTRGISGDLETLEGLLAERIRGLGSEQVDRFRRSESLDDVKSSFPTDIGRKPR